VRIGTYEVVRELGRGGMGVVYLARRDDGRDVALKVLLKDSEPARARFEREKRLLAEFGEAEGFVPLIDSGLSGRHPFLVMPLVPGGTLRDRLDRGPLTVDETVALGFALGLALGLAHARGIVHRDLKPDNVLFTADGRPLIADLGVAKHFRTDVDGASRSVLLSTQGGGARGTWGYMPPEQMSDATKVDARADVFSLGVILYECLAGRAPFQGETLTEVCAATATGSYVRLAKARPDAPAPLARMIERALAPVPEKRFDDGAAFAAALTELPAALAAARSRSLRIAAVVAVVVLVAGAGLALSRGAGPPPLPPVSPVAPSPRPPTAVAPDDSPPLDDRERPLSAYRRQREWVARHPTDPRAAEIARRLEMKSKRPLATCTFKRRAKGFWVGATTLLVLDQKEDGPFVVDMDTSSPRPIPLPRLKPTLWGCFSGALHRGEGSVRWVVGADKNVYVIEGDPREPSTMIGREAFVFPDSDEPVVPPGTPTRVLAIAISPDGKTAAAGGDWHEVYLIDLEHPGLPARPLRPAHGGTVLSLAFAAGRLLVGNGASGASEPGLFVFDLGTGQQVADQRFEFAVTSIAPARDGRFAIGMSDGGIIVKNLDATEAVPLPWPMSEWSTREEPTSIMGLAFVDGGARLVAVSGANLHKKMGSRLFTRSSRSGEEPARLLAGDLDALVSLDVSEDGRLVAIGSQEGLIEVRALPD
jgi:serine/threonine protein kinase